MEPERPIEKLLQAMAKKRREQAGDALEMHPAARQELQREVSRRRMAKKRGGPFWSLFSVFTPKLAFAVCVLAIVGFGLWRFLPFAGKPKPSTLAMNGSSFEKALPQSRREIAAPQPVSSAPVMPAENANSAPAAQVAPPTEAAEDRRRFGAAPETPSQFKQSEGSAAQAGPSTAAQPANAPTPLFDAAKSGGALASARTLDKDTSQFAALPPVVATNAVTSAVTVAAAEPEGQKKPGAPNAETFYRVNRAAVSDTLSNYEAVAPGQAVSQRFRQAVVTTPHVAGTAGAATAVLASFQVVQNSNQIRVVDADGSVYTGSFTMPTESQSRFASPTSAGSVLSGSRAAKAEPPPPVTRSYSFRVAGTNRYLNQNVVFSGNLIPLAPPKAAAFGGMASSGQEVPGTWLLLNSRIVGKAAIGSGREIEVNAAPVR